MTPTQLTPAFKVGIASTCSGAWPVIYEPHTDPATGEDWNREVASGNTAFVETEAHRLSGKSVNWNEDPDAFEPFADSAEAISEAYLLAAAPMMADALRAVLRSRSAPEGLKKLARAALAATEPPAVLPQADPMTE